MAKTDSIEGQLNLFGEPQTPSRGVGPADFGSDLIRLGEALSGQVYLGTSSWNFPGWKGIVYAKHSDNKALSRDGLGAYARHPLFRSVSLDRAYYGPLPVEEYARLKESLPPTFRMVVKAHEDCSVARYPGHQRYGSKAGQKNPLFLDPAYATEMVVEPARQGLAENLGPIVFQFPPQNPADLGGPVGFAERLYHFLDDLPQGPLYAVELRNKTLLSGMYGAVLERLGASHCFNIHPTMPPLVDQARWVTAGPALVIRWMLGGRQKYDQAKKRYYPFNRVVDPDQQSLAAVANLVCQAVADDRLAYVIANNKAEGSAPLTLERLARYLLAH